MRWPIVSYIFYPRKRKRTKWPADKFEQVARRTEPKGEFVVYNSYDESIGGKYSTMSDAIAAAQEIVERDGEDYPSLRVLKLVANVKRTISVDVTVYP